MKLDGALATIEHEGDRLALRRRRAPAAGRGARRARGPQRARVRREHPRHGRRRGEDERERLRRRPRARARVGRGRDARAAPSAARAGRARLRLPALEPRAARGRGARLVRARADAEPRAVKATLADMRAARRAAQPSGIKTFGSTFKNPDDPRAEGRSAGVLLEEAGCRGLQVGGARFSEKHANFVENMGEATTADVLALMAEGRRRVRERFGVELEPEVQLLGEVDALGALGRATRERAARRRGRGGAARAAAGLAVPAAAAARAAAARAALADRARGRLPCVLAAGYQLLVARLLARGGRAGAGHRPDHQGRRARPRGARRRRAHDDHAARRSAPSSSARSPATRWCGRSTCSADFPHGSTSA